MPPEVGAIRLSSKRLIVFGNSFTTMRELAAVEENLTTTRKFISVQGWVCRGYVLTQIGRTAGTIPPTVQRRRRSQDLEHPAELEKVVEPHNHQHPR